MHKNFSYLKYVHIYIYQDIELEARPSSRQLTVKYEREKTSDFPKYASVDESNALMNWQAKMRERRKQQGYLSSEYQIYMCVACTWTLPHKTCIKKNTVVDFLFNYM